MLDKVPARIAGEEQLDAFLAEPYPETVDMMRRLDGDILILGVGGKIGPSLARMAVNACREAGVSKRVIGVSLDFGTSQKTLESWGVETIPCDFAEAADVDKLPRAGNVIFMAGRKFGVVGTEPLTWISNTVVPANVAQTFRDSRIVAFSTGCVYKLMPPGKGSVETDEAIPVGEYANSCLGRERVFEYYSEKYGTRVLMFRLNYAIDLRYGVLFDIAQRVHAGEPVDLTVGVANVIWQGDVNNRALLCLEQAAAPPAKLNITGPEEISTRNVAGEFGRIFGVKVKFTGTEGQQAYLSCADRSFELFGRPRVSVPRMIEWIADWIRAGGRSLDAPTHFSVTDGQYLDEKKGS